MKFRGAQESQNKNFMLIKRLQQELWGTILIEVSPKIKKGLSKDSGDKNGETEKSVLPRGVVIKIVEPNN